MSRAWQGGTTRRWAKIRRVVLDRDKWICQLCKQLINPNLGSPHPRSASVHHTRGKRYGDDLRDLVAAHRQCNLEAGEPGTVDPPPVSATQW